MKMKLLAALVASAGMLLAPVTTLAARTYDPGYVFYETINGQSVKIITAYDAKRNNTSCSYYTGTYYAYSDGTYIQSGQVGTSSSSDLETFCLTNYPNRTVY
jgi:hypothetical protein